MKITKMTRWRVFAGVWIQSLFTSATAFFSLFALPLTSQFGWSSADFSMAYTIYMFVYCAMGFVGGLLAEKLQPRMAIYLGLSFFAAGWFLTGFASSIPQLYLFYGAQMACRILAVIFLIGVGAVAWMIVPCPKGWIPEGWKPTATQAKELRTKNYNIPEMVKTPVFWVMLIMFILP